MNRDDELVRDWIALIHAEEGTAEHAGLIAAHGSVSDLVADDPEAAWQFVLQVLATDSSPTVTEVLAAGPLEDLLAEHGRALIERIESEARRNPAFAFLLGGVWRSSIDEDIWTRVQAARDRRGWDGIPRS